MADTNRPELGSLVDAGGIKTNYLEAGEGPPVVLIHGSGPGVTSYANWRAVIPALADNFIGLVYDHRAFDGSTASRFLLHLRDALQARDWAAEVS